MLFIQKILIPEISHSKYDVIVFVGGAIPSIWKAEATGEVAVPAMQKTSPMNLKK